MMTPHFCKLNIISLTAIAGLSLLGLASGARANGTAYYFDVNGTSAGFGSPAGSYTNNTALWTTSTAGTGTPVALPTGAQMTFGYTNSDFNGNTFSVNLTNIAWSGLTINSTNANITLVGAGNGYNYAVSTWTVAGGSTLTEADLFNGYGLNFNNANVFLYGSGIVNFDSCVGYNSTQTVQENMTNGTVNLGYAWNAGTAHQANFQLVSGTLNFTNAASATMFNGLGNSGGGSLFRINGNGSGCTIDNTSGSAMTLGLGAGSYNISGSFTFKGSSSLNFGTRPVALVANTSITINQNTLTIGGVISGTGYGITTAGNGTLELGGADTYTGNTTVTGGTLDLANQLAVQDSLLTMGGGSLVFDSSVSGNAFTAAGLAASASGPGYNIALQNNAASPAPVALTLNAYPVQTTYAGILSGAGSLTIGSPVSLILSATNTFAGNTTLSGGALDLQNQYALENSTLIMSGGTLTFDSAVSGNAFTLGGLAASTNGSGYNLVLNNGSADVALTVGGNNASTTYAGVLSDSASSGSLQKVGAGTLRLSGANTYGGATTVNDGQLAGVVGGGCQNSAVTVAATTGNSAVLGVNYTGGDAQWTCSSLVINNGGTSSGLQFNFGSLTPSTVNAPLNISGSVSFTTPPTISISAASLPTTSGNGYPLLTWGSGSAPSLSGVTLVLPPRISGSLAIVANTLYLKSGGSTEPISWTGGSGAWDINDSGNVIWKDDTGASTYYEQGVVGDSVVFDNTVGSGGTVTLNTNVVPASFTVNNPSANYVITGTGGISGSTALAKSGAGVLTLATTNSYSGGTVLSAGQLNINNGGSSALNSAIGTGPLTIAGPSTIDNTGAADVTLQPAIAENWNADFTYAGSAHNLNLGSGAIALGGNRQVTVAANNLTVPGVIIDNGNGYSLTMAGNGTLTLANANNYSGVTTINAGTLNANVAGALGNSGTTTVNGTLNLNAGAVIYNGVNTVSGSGTINVALGAGSAATYLNGNNSGFTGTLNVGTNGLTGAGASAGSGKLQLLGTLPANATVNVLSNATVYVTGAVNQPAAVTLYGGNTSESFGQLRVDAGATWSGPITLAGIMTGQDQGIVGSESGFGYITGNIGETGGSWALSKSGGDNIVLSGTNTYSGATIDQNSYLYILNDQSGAVGGLAVAPDNNNFAEILIGSASLQTAPTMVAVASGNLIQVGANTNATSYGVNAEDLAVSGGNGYLTTVTNYGTLLAGRNSTISVGTGAFWFQSGLVDIQPIGGYAATLAINNGGEFAYTGTNAIELTENTGTTATSTLSIGNNATSGTFITGQPFNYNGNSGNASGVAQIELLGGTVSLSTNVPQLTTGDASGRFLLGTNGVIDTAGYSTSLGTGITNASGQTGSMVKNSNGTLTLLGTNTYSGPTIINGGTLAMAGTASLSGSILVGGGATFDVSGLTTPPYPLAAGQVLANTNYPSSAGLGGSLSVGAGAELAINYSASSVPAFTVTNGTLTLNASSTFVVNNVGSALDNGQYLIISTNSGGHVAGSMPAVTVVGSGFTTATNASLVVQGGQLYLNVPAVTVNTASTNITATVSGNQLTLTWPTDHTGWSLQVQTNSLATGLGTNWVTIPGSNLSNSYTNTINSVNGAVFYRMVYP